MAEADFSSVTWDRKEESEPMAAAGAEVGPIVEESVDSGVTDTQDPEESPVNPSQEDKTVKKPDSIYIKSVVSDPQKEQDGPNAYVTYLIVTESNSPVFQSSHLRIRRRFSDFYFLYQSLLTDFPACAVPPLPDKQRLEYITGDRFGKEFTSKRANSLNRFLSRISNHPVLKRSNVYHAFLESTDWNSFKKSVTIRHQVTAAEPSVVDSISDSFMNAFKKAHTQSKEFVEVKEKADKLDDNLAKLEKIFTKVVRREGELESDYKDFANHIMKLADLEPNLNKEFIAFSEGLLKLSRGFGELKETIDNNYMVSLKDMEYYVGSLKMLLKQKDQKQIDYEALSDYLAKAEHEKSSLQSGGGSNFLRMKVEDLRGVDHDQSRKERLNKLEGKITQLTAEVENAKKTVDAFEDQTYHEIQYFDTIKALEMKDTLGDLADSHIHFFENIIADWEKVEAELA